MNPRRAPHFLVVDDHSLVRHSLQTGILAAFPKATVAQAANAIEAMDALNKARPDLVLLDVNLPGINGIELAKKILLFEPDIKILIVAGESDPWTVDQALKAGVSGFVTKVCTVTALSQYIQDILKGKLVLTQDVRDALSNDSNPDSEFRNIPAPAILSDREKQILKYLAHGENTKTIAHLLDISPKTVETHRGHIIEKLGINSIALLTRYAIRHGLMLA